MNGPPDRPGEGARHATAFVADATAPELTASVSGGVRTAIVPLGATEQHGPHLPCGTDTLRADALVRRVVAVWEEPVFVTPTLPLGASDEHGGFAGLVGVSTATFTEVLVDVATRLGWWGVRRVVFLNTHGGNAPALAAARARLARELPWLRVDAPTAAGAHAAVAEEDGVDVPHRGLHAGETETSEVWAIAPDQVRRHALAPGHVEAAASTLASLRTQPVRALSASGVIGDPTRADPARGARYLDAVARRIVAELRER